MSNKITFETKIETGPFMGYLDEMRVPVDSFFNGAIEKSDEQ